MFLFIVVLYFKIIVYGLRNVLWMKVWIKNLIF